MATRCLLRLPLRLALRPAPTASASPASFHSWSRTRRRPCEAGSRLPDGRTPSSGAVLREHSACLGQTRHLCLDHRNRLSNIWVPVPPVLLKDAKDDEESHAKLVRAGFFRQAHAGVFHMLPLGLRVQNKIEALVDKHMKAIGASRVSLSSFSSEALWAASGRLDSVKAELFRFADRKDARYLLSPTHEEEITELVRQNVQSYRGLPLRLYQITRKYRDEMRPRHGILRSREFVMKDLYSFDASVDDALATYEQVRGAYAAFFAELKVPVLAARASSGDMGGSLSHEYLLAASLGEDAVAHCTRCGSAANTEVLEAPAAAARTGDDCADCGAPGTLVVERAIELGHTFYLGTRYTGPSALDVTVQGPAASEAAAETAAEAAAGERGAAASDDAALVPLMGCYGLGISRILGAVADQRADARGLNWPRAIAPYEVVVVAAPPPKAAKGGQGGQGGQGVKGAKGGLAAVAEGVYDELTRADSGPGKPPRPALDVLLDDRAHASLPYKLKDADLTGYPVVVVVGAAWRKSAGEGAGVGDGTGDAPLSPDGLCEVQCRQLGIRQDVPLRELRAFVAGLLDQL